MTDTINKKTSSLLEIFKQSIDKWLLGDNGDQQAQEYMEWFEKAREQAEENKKQAQSEAQREANGDALTDRIFDAIDRRDTAASR
jgi:hypothetical protein